MSSIVLGAGMAGLAAARALKDAGEAVVILEAKGRLGGRTYTNRDFANHPVEFGAEFIHGEYAKTWDYVKFLGLDTLHWKKTDDSMVRLENDAWLTMSEARSQFPDFDLTRSWLLPEVDPLPNEDWRSYLVRIGFDNIQLRYVARSFANACGESMRFISATAALETIRNRQDGMDDYRILSGYDSIVNHLAQGLEIHLDDPVLSVDWSLDQGVRVKSLDGCVYQADSLVITVPLGVLQHGAITFTPELPELKQTALRGLRMGPVIKMMYRLNQAPVEPGIMAIYSKYNPPMWWSPSYGFSSNEHVWSAFVSGDQCMELLNQGEQAALKQGLHSLRLELKRPDLDFSDAHLENWPDDPYTQGGYSYVLPGHEDARAKLASPTPPLFWAGEATANEHQAATVHGALLSGERAAAELLSYQQGKLIPPIASNIGMTHTEDPSETQSISSFSEEQQAK